MSHVTCASVASKSNKDQALTWMDCSRRAVDLVEKVLNTRHPEIRNDEVRNGIRMAIGVIAAFGDPMSDPFLTGLYSDDDRERLVDADDQVKIHEAVLLVQQQIGRMAVGRDRGRVGRVQKSKSADEVVKRKRESFFELTQIYAVMPGVLHRLVEIIGDNLAIDAEKPFTAQLTDVLYDLLRVLPPINRTNRESWMQMLGGIPATPKSSSESTASQKFQDWVHNMQDLLLTLLFSEREEDHELAGFIVKTFEVDLAAQYVLSMNKNKGFKGNAGVEVPGKKKKKAESENITVFTNKPTTEEEEEVDDTDKHGYISRIPSMFPMALITLRPSPEDFKSNPSVNQFLSTLCKGLFDYCEDDNLITPVQVLIGRLISVCMDALATYGLNPQSKVARKVVEPIKKFDDIVDDSKRIVRDYIRIIAEHMINKEDGKGLGMMQRLIAVTWLRRELMNLSI
ncbi:hypothetical protein QR680_006498 [Steinernema hermaphroditum]|uniref:Uncharacterized protein n=1 Tax=Steinernema hermaphroditum TaxID=289476 RepID=A0AA39HX55_9BILA|nr:hypothetical protein QR680_006498 [Steinernema hermaphroditum]